MSRRIALFLLLLVLFACPVRAEEDAENMNLRGTWTFAGGKIAPRSDPVTDNNSETKRVLKAGKTLRIGFPEGTEPRQFCAEWYEKPYRAAVERYDGGGILLGRDVVSESYVTVTALEPGTREIVLRPLETALSVAGIDVFGAGLLPETYRGFLPLPEKLDYMVIAAHPDDDVLFLGAVVPYLGGEEGLAGTIVYMTEPVLHQRHVEALNGARTMGLLYEPVFGPFKDMYAANETELARFVDPEEAVTYLVRLIRQYRPTLLFTHGPAGEYGHTEHKFFSAAALQAAEKAQDPQYDKRSSDFYGTWQVQKLYWHDYEEGPSLLFDPDAQLASFGGKTAYEICREAFQKHVSQSSRAYAVHRYGEHENSFNFFGLAYPAVGGKAEIREGIDPALFSDYVPPTPAQTTPARTTPARSTSAPSTPAAEQTIPEIEAPDVSASFPEAQAPDPSAPVSGKTDSGAPLPSQSEPPVNAPAQEPLLDGYALAAIAVLLLLGFIFGRLWWKKWKER